MNRFYPLCFILLLAAINISSPLARSGVSVSASEAAQIALQHVPGRVLKVTTRQDYYRVKVLKESGRVVVIIIDSGSGQITRIEGNNSG